VYWSIYRDLALRLGDMMSVKIIFRLEQDSDGYPPVEYEGIWAEHQGGKLYAIDNIPFFTRAATLGDIIEADVRDNEYIYLRTVTPSANSLLRVVYYDPKEIAIIRTTLEQLGCSSELNDVHHLISVNIPQGVALDTVQAFLAGGFQSDRWDYEEAMIRH
jgi:Domain of unknown function (DUF4265)